MPWRSALCLAALAGVVAAAIVVVPAGGGSHHPAPSRLEAAAAWSGLVGSARVPVGTGQRVLVVLTAFSLADRVQRAGGLAGDSDERRWTSAARRRAAAVHLPARPRGRDRQARVPLHPHASTASRRSSTRGRSRCSSALRGEGRVSGSRRLPGDRPLAARARGGRSGAEAGRAALRDRRPRGDDRSARHRRRPAAAVPARARPGRNRRRRRAASAQAQAKPTDPAQLEAHGTEMAGLLVGAGGPGGLAGVAPARPSCRSAWPRGSPTAAATTPSTRAPTSCSPASSARRPERRRRRPRRRPDRAHPARRALRGVHRRPARARRRRRLAAGHARRRRGRQRRAGRARLRQRRRPGAARPTRSPSARSTRAAPPPTCASSSAPA